MDNLALLPRCALGGDKPEARLIAGLKISENPGLAMASLAARSGQEGEVLKAARKLTGFALPGPGGLAGAGDWQAFWAGPGQWLVTAPFSSHEDIARIVKSAVAAAASVTEQTDGWVRFEVAGARVCEMFERLCNVDVRAMKSGRATRCQIEHLGSFLLCNEAGAAFSVLTLRSGARSMFHALESAARSLP